MTGDSPAWWGITLEWSPLTAAHDKALLPSGGRHKAAIADKSPQIKRRLAQKNEHKKGAVRKPKGKQENRARS
jgi:hypothetical protein